MIYKINNKYYVSSLPYYYGVELVEENGEIKLKPTDEVLLDNQVNDYEIIKQEDYKKEFEKNNSYKQQTKNKRYEG